MLRFVTAAVKDTIETYVASVMLSVRQPFAPNGHGVIDGQDGRVIRLTSPATVIAPARAGTYDRRGPAGGHPSR